MGRDEGGEVKREGGRWEARGWGVWRRGEEGKTGSPVNVLLGFVSFNDLKIQVLFWRKRFVQPLRSGMSWRFSHRIPPRKGFCLVQICYVACCSLIRAVLTF